MDHLITEHKNPVYLENLYRLTPKPAFLKQDVNWDASTLEDLECSYCGEFNSKDLYEDASTFIYVNPKGYLIIGNDNGINKINIMFCPMCGKLLK